MQYFEDNIFVSILYFFSKSHVQRFSVFTYILGILESEAIDIAKIGKPVKFLEEEDV